MVEILLNKKEDMVRILIDCHDQKGLVCKISQVFYEQNLNIESNQEFVDKEQGRFFMRSVVVGAIDLKKLENQLQACLPQNAQLKIIVPQKKNIVLLVTKESHALGDLLIRHSADELDAQIKAVISNHKTLEKLVKRFDIPFHFVPTDDLNRIQHEENIDNLLSQYPFDYLVLAKYMRILTPEFVNQYSEKIINIHHSFLPAFIGANPYKQAFERGVKIIGATAHFVTSDLDEGPIIAQNITPINHRYNWKDMQKAGRDVEKNVLSRALDLVLNDRVFIDGNKTIVF